MRYNAHVFNKIGIGQPLKQKSRAICTAFKITNSLFGGCEPQLQTLQIAGDHHVGLT